MKVWGERGEEGYFDIQTDWYKEMKSPLSISDFADI